MHTLHCITRFLCPEKSFTLAPGQTRENRVGFRNPARFPNERAYRLVVEEVPSAVGAREGATVNLVMRYVLPVFIAPAAKQADEMVWSVRRQGGSVVVRAENRGNRRVAVSALGFNARADAPGEPIHAVAAREAVLAQTWRKWTVEVPAGVALETLLVRTNLRREFEPVSFSQ